MRLEDISKIYKAPPTMAVEKKTNKNKTKLGFKKSTFDKVLTALKSAKEITRVDLISGTGLSQKTVDKVMDYIIDCDMADKRMVREGKSNSVIFKVVCCEN